MYITVTDPELGRLMRCRSRLGSKARGWAAVAFSLKFVEHNGISTMATDGTSLFWSRAYIQSISNKHVEGGIVHEACHKILLHHLRRPKGVSPERWNIATDYVINLIVRDAGLFLPDGALYDEAYRGMSAEQVLRSSKFKKDHPEEPKGQPGGDQPEDGQSEDGQPKKGDGQPGPTAPGQPKNFDRPGEVWDAVNDDGEPLSEPERRKVEENVRRDIIVAAAIEKVAGAGTITLGDGILETAKAAHVDWVEVLADILTRAFGGEPTLAAPARRHLWRGEYLPSYKGVGGGVLVLAIDTSGSTYSFREQFAAEVDGIRELIKPDRTVVIYCDSHIQKSKNGDLYDEFDSWDDIVVRNIYGGGTRFHPPFALVEQEGLNPSALIYLTDGYGSVESATAELVDYPVLWATTGIAPTFVGAEFGEIVKVDL
jgi:predicted metal-dependent peptidase